MSARAATWILWLVLLVVAPVPYWSIQAGREPVLNLAVFSGATLIATIAEPSGISAFVAFCFVAQTCFWAWILRRVSRRIASLADQPRRRAALILGVAGVAVAAALLPIYVTPFSSAGSTGSLLTPFLR